MNEREKRLVIVMGAMAFLIVNLFLYFRVYSPRRADAQVKIRQYEATLANADTFMRMRDEVADEIDWLEKNQAKVAPVQDVSADLQRFAQTEASPQRSDNQEAADSALGGGSGGHLPPRPGRTRTQRHARSRFTAGSTGSRRRPNSAPSHRCASPPSGRTTP